MSPHGARNSNATHRVCINETAALKYIYGARGGQPKYNYNQSFISAYLYLLLLLNHLNGYFLPCRRLFVCINLQNNQKIFLSTLMKRKKQTRKFDQNKRLNFTHTHTHATEFQLRNENDNEQNHLTAKWKNNVKKNIINIKYKKDRIKRRTNARYEWWKLIISQIQDKHCKIWTPSLCGLLIHAQSTHTFIRWPILVAIYKNKQWQCLNH